MNPVLAALPRFATSGAVAIKPGLDRIRALLAALGHPEEDLPVILVAGTNGKGSVASMAAAILTAAGYRTGLHTSPHLLDVTERMRLDGRSAPASWLDDTVARYRSVLESVGPSYFEALVALSLLYFRHAGAQVAVVEVGLGGRLDATNVLDATVSVITSIGLDHMDLLGDTLEAIAAEKAGIIKPERPVVVGALAPGPDAVVRDVAARLHAPVVPGDTVTLPDDCAVDLPGLHQIQNARVALGAVRALEGFPVSDDAVRSGLGRIRQLSGLRARLETISTAPRVIVDMGHNADAIATALAALADDPVDIVVLGMLQDKDVEAVGRVLGAHTGSVWLVPTPGDRGLSTGVLASRLGHADARKLRSVDDALASVRQTGLSALFIGSHHVAEAVLRRLS